MLENLRRFRRATYYDATIKYVPTINNIPMQDEPLMQIELAATTAMRSCVGSPHMRRLVSVLDQRRPKSQNGRAIICLWMLCDLMQLVIILDERDCDCLNRNGYGQTCNRHVACERVSMVSKQVWHNGGTDHFTYELAPCPFFLAGSEHADCLHRTMHICRFKVCHLQARTLKDAGP